MLKIDKISKCTYKRLSSRFSFHFSSSIMFKQVIFALFISIAFIDFANGSCRDITLDACEYGNEGPFETLKGIKNYVKVHDTSTLLLPNN